MSASRTTAPNPTALLAAVPPLAERFEIHISSVEDGVARMRPAADGIEIGPGETAELKPGGTHIMFIKPSGLPDEGRTFPASLTFEKAGTVEVEFTVETMRGPTVEEPPAADHGGHGEPVP